MQFKQGTLCRNRVVEHLQRIYTELDHAVLADRLLSIMAFNDENETLPERANKWNEQDVWMITYGDSVQEANTRPLTSLKEFIDQRLSNVINGVHILPFFPYSSDDGFSVINYKQVNESLGEWQDIRAIAKDYHLMADLVINHCSARSQWFENYKQRKDPGKDYFAEALPTDDLSMVVRPRTSDLLKEVETLDGTRHVWCTFGHDQVDLDFSNPEVLCEMVEIVHHYLENGVRVFRLDAVAFLWKEIGSDSIHLPQTHEVVRLLRTLIEAHSADAVIITETNVPNVENLSYFGNANEAHAVYNFSLPPLVLHALLSGSSEHLKAWQMSMPPAQMGTFYFNFLASHDGIGLRPAEGLLSEQDINSMVDAVQDSGGKVSWRTTEGESRKPYELNVTLFDALQGSFAGKDTWQVQRFLCAHAIMLSLEGVPGIYIHSFLGTNNYLEGVEGTGHNRTINRFKWDYAELTQQLDSDSHHAEVFQSLCELITIRRKQEAFHPNAIQYTLHLGDDVFAFWRQSIHRDQSIFCIHNVTDRQIEIPLKEVNLISLDNWCDLVSDTQYGVNDTMVLAPYQFVWLSNKNLSC